MSRDVTFDKVVIDEDDGFTYLDDYLGLRWGNFCVTSPREYREHYDWDASPGLKNGLTSGHQVAFSSYEGAAEIYSDSGTFTFKQANITAMQADDVTIEITGYLHQEVVYQTSVTVALAGPTALVLNFKHIDQIEFYATEWHGGQDAGRFVFDDVVVGGLHESEPASRHVADAGAHGDMISVLHEQLHHLQAIA